MIQRVSRRRIEQLWQSYRRTGIVPALGKPGRPRKTGTSLRDTTLVMKAYDELKVNALTLARARPAVGGIIPKMSRYPNYISSKAG